ncbi:hypothetical protein APUTEX25_005047, partial [Auxenochlorella protothecoides]
MQRAWPGCLATKRWVLGAVALAIGVPAAKGAQAQVPFGPVGGDVTTYYDGIVYRVQLRYTGLSDVHTNVAELRDYLGVLAVDCDAGPAFDATTLAACGAESPYKCTSQACPGARWVEVALVNNLGSQRVLFNLPGGGPQAAWLILTLTVRMHPSATRCGASTVCALDVGNGDVLGSPQTSGGGENTACQSAARPVLTAVWIGPTPPVQGHNVAGVGLTWQLQAQLSNGSMVAPVGLPDPPSGDVAVTLGTPPLATPVRLGIEVERAVTRLSVALSLPGQAAVARVLVAAAVDGATNASGGEEPSRATFVVVAAAAPARLAEAQALLQPSGPGSAASSAPSPQVADLTLTVRARHTHPDGSATPGRHAVDLVRRQHAAGPRRLLCRGQRHP